MAKETMKSGRRNSGALRSRGTLTTVSEWSDSESTRSGSSMSTGEAVCIFRLWQMMFTKGRTVRAYNATGTPKLP